MLETSRVKVAPAALQWYQQHKANILQKQNEYALKWNKASEQQHQQLTLSASDDT